MVGSLLTLLLLTPQTDWAALAKEWLIAWRAGGVNLLSQAPLTHPRFLDPKDERVQALIKARGSYFSWSEEAELSFICSGLAASMDDKDLGLLLDIGLVRTARSPEQELSSARAEKGQPWLVRGQVLRTIESGNDPRLAARAQALLAARKDGDLFTPALAAAVLARRGGPEHRAVLEALLQSPEARLRVAALGGLRGIASGESLAPLRAALERETDPGVRGWLWHALGAVVAGLGEPDKREPHAEGDAIVARAIERLGDKQVALRERVAVCGFLWQARPKQALPELPRLLGQEQPATGGDPLLRWWIHGLLVDMHGTGTGRRPSSSGQTGTGFDAGPDQPEAWAEFIAGRRNLYVLDRGREVTRPEPPKDAPMIFGLPVHGRRVVLLVDGSQPMGAPWPGSTSGGADSAARADERLTVLGKLASECETALAALPPGAEVRIVVYHRTATAFPSQGYAKLDKATATKAAAFVREQRPQNVADHASALLGACGVVSTLPFDLARFDGEPPDQICWIIGSSPTAGVVQAPRALADLMLASWPSHQVPLHVALVGDRNRSRGPTGGSRSSPNREWQRLGDETRGRYSFVSGTAGRR